MKKFTTSLAAIALSLVLALSSMSAFAAGKTAKSNDYFNTTMYAARDYVVVNVNLSRRSNLTSGQVVLFYDPEVMELQWGFENSFFEIADVNDDYGKGAVSFVWASDEAARYAENLMTLTFKVKDAKNGQKVSVVTDVVEAYQDFVALENGEDKTNTVTIRLPKFGGFFNRFNETGNDVNRFFCSILRYFW
ncbi:MAG: hypothetical protein J5626_01985 [Lachnospiraceae bacterium]|nr:hypothetical protein [Lachnospiraceae bacterium]